MKTISIDVTTSHTEEKKIELPIFKQIDNSYYAIYGTEDGESIEVIILENIKVASIQPITSNSTLKQAISNGKDITHATWLEKSNIAISMINELLTKGMDMFHEHIAHKVESEQETKAYYVRTK